MKTKVAIAFIIAITLLLPACSADGGLIAPPHVWNNIQQTQQVAVMDVDMEKGVYETSLFISLQDLTDESHTVRWVIPLEEMPDDFNIVKMTFGDFMDKHEIYDKRWGFEEFDDAGENVKESYKEGLRYVYCIFNVNACRYYYRGPMPLYGGYKGAPEMAVADAAITPTQVTYYGSTLLEVFNTTSETSLDQLFQQVGVSEELASKYDRYKGKYFYITFMQTEPLLEEEPEIEGYCPTTYQDILNYIQSFESDEYGGFWSTQEMYTDQCIREANVKGNYTSEDRIREIIWQLFDSVIYSYEGDIAGVEITFSSPIGEGEELYYPLGTGDMWSEPIDNIEIYAEMPNSHSLDYNERIFDEETKVYRWQYEEENPTEDILLEVEKRGEKMAYARQKSLFWFARYGYSIPVLLFIFSWIVAAALVITPKKDRLKCRKLFRLDTVAQAFLLFGIFFVPTYIVSSMLISVYSVGAPIAGFAALWYYLKNYKKEKKEQAYKKPAKIIGGAIGIFIIMYYLVKFLLGLVF